MNSSPDHPEHDDEPREQPAPDGDEQNDDYPNGEDVSEVDDDGGAVG